MTDPLFSSDDARAATKPLLVLTNRSNVVDFLSSGLLRPKQAMEKYYTDLSELVDGVVPVVAGRLTEELVDFVARRPTQFPVAVEVTSDVVSATDHPQVGTIDVATLESVVCLHLQTADDLDELTARRFDNVDWNRVRFIVSPEIFEGGETSIAEIREAIAPRDEPLPFATHDRLGGARLLALHAVPPERGALESLARLVFEQGSRKAEDPSVTSWLTIDASLTDYAPPPTAEYDERVYRAAASRCMAASRKDAWDPAAFLEGITRVLRDDPALASDDAARWEKAAERAGEIVSASRVFEGFNASGYSSEGAVLLAALRGDVEDVLAWRDEDIGGNGWTLTVAAVFVGLVHGRTAIGTALRPLPLDLALARLERAGLLSHSWSAPLEVVARDSEEVLIVDGVDVSTVPRSTASVSELADQLDTQDPATASALLRLAQDMGWHQFVETAIGFDGPFTHELAEGGSRIRFRGEPQIDYDVDAEAVLAHVRTEGDDRARYLLEQIVNRTDSTEIG